MYKLGELNRLLGYWLESLGTGKPVPGRQEEAAKKALTEAWPAITRVWKTKGAGLKPGAIIYETEVTVYTLGGPPPSKWIMNKDVSRQMDKAFFNEKARTRGWFPVQVQFKYIPDKSKYGVNGTYSHSDNVVTVYISDVADPLHVYQIVVHELTHAAQFDYDGLTAEKWVISAGTQSGYVPEIFSDGIEDAIKTCTMMGYIQRAQRIKDLVRPLGSSPTRQDISYLCHRLYLDLPMEREARIAQFIHSVTPEFLGEILLDSANYHNIFPLLTKILRMDRNQERELMIGVYRKISDKNFSYKVIGYLKKNIEAADDKVRAALDQTSTLTDLIQLVKSGVSLPEKNEYSGWTSDIKYWTLPEDIKG